VPARDGGVALVMLVDAPAEAAVNEALCNKNSRLLMIALLFRLAPTIFAQEAGLTSLNRLRADGDF
jgi:hypothetical protein